jgi:hypothetical protein
MKRNGIRVFLALAAFAARPACAGEWTHTQKPNCDVWNESPQPKETVTWTGSCRDGRAQGQGIETWYSDGKMTSIHTGLLTDGKGGEGYTTIKDVNGSSYDGNLKASAPDGPGTLKDPEGNVLRGQWKSGNLVDGDFISAKGETHKAVVGFGRAYLGMQFDEFKLLNTSEQSKGFPQQQGNDTIDLYVNHENVDGVDSEISYGFINGHLNNIYIRPAKFHDAGYSENIDEGACREKLQDTAEIISNKYGKFDSPPQLTYQNAQYNSKQYMACLSNPTRSISIKEDYQRYESGGARCEIAVIYQFGNLCKTLTQSHQKSPY